MHRDIIFSTEMCEPKRWYVNISRGKQRFATIGRYSSEQAGLRVIQNMIDSIRLGDYEIRRVGKEKSI